MHRIASAGDYLIYFLNNSTMMLLFPKESETWTAKHLENDARADMPAIFQPLNAPCPRRE